jgi:hypothetical protein
MDSTLIGHWIKFCMKLVTVICLGNTTVNFIALLVNWYNNELLPILRQFFLIPKRINEFMDFRTWRRLFFFYFCCSHLEHRASVKRFGSLQFLNLGQSVGFLGRGISPSQGRYLAQTQNKHRHPCLSGLRTHDPSVRVGEDISCLRPRGIQAIAFLNA